MAAAAGYRSDQLAPAGVFNRTRNTYEHAPLIMAMHGHQITQHRKVAAAVSCEQCEMVHGRQVQSATEEIWLLTSCAKKTCMVVKLQYNTVSHDNNC